MKNLILSIIIVSFISFFSCTQSKSKEETDVNIKGHMIFNFEVEMDKPIYPIILATNNDSSFQRYSKRQINRKTAIGNKQIPSILGLDGCYYSHNIERIEPKMYNEIKSTILSYYPYESHSEVEKQFQGLGAGVLISDTKDSTIFYIPADSMFNKSIDAIIQITEQYKNKKLTSSFQYLKKEALHQASILIKQ